jgi:hypothetical protein
MINADKFKSIFGLYAAELWSMTEKDFLKWLNSEAMNCSEIPNNSDTISRQAAINGFYEMASNVDYLCTVSDYVHFLECLPSAEPEIIYCKDCKHWTQTTGKMKGYGLGKCDFHDADLVTCNAYCYWAERRSDE